MANQTTEAPATAATADLLVDKVAKRIDGISTLPHVALRVMEVANDDRSGAADLKAVLEADPALSARVLRCVNSSAYALRTKVTNLQLAIAYLGLKQIRNLAVTASVSDIFKKDEQVGSYSRAGLWKHLVSVGICARLIALRQRLPEFEDTFLAGLLHDIGIILEDQHMHNPFCQMIQSLSPSKTLAECEREHFGFDHTQLGERVAELWKFPQAAQAAIAYHHASVVYRGEHAPTVRCVEVANLICTLKGVSSVGVNLLRSSRAVLDAMSLSKEDIEVLASDLDHELELHANLFTL